MSLWGVNFPKKAQLINRLPFEVSDLTMNMLYFRTVGSCCPWIPKFNLHDLVLNQIHEINVIYEISSFQRWCRSLFWGYDKSWTKWPSWSSLIFQSSSTNKHSHKKEKTHSKLLVISRLARCGFWSDMRLGSLKWECTKEHHSNIKLSATQYQCSL